MSLTRILSRCLMLFAFLMLHFHGSGIAQTKSELFSRDSLQLVQELKDMAKNDQRYRKSDKTYRKNVALQTAIDSANTLRLMAITGTYGFPSAARFTGKEKGVVPHILLVHAPKAFHDTLKVVLAAEKEAGRISPFEYAHVVWHLNGRQGVPPFEGATIKKRGRSTIVIY